MVDRLLRAFLVIGGVSAACAWTWPGAFPEADPLAVLVRYHTPNFYRAAVAWYYVDHGASLCALSAGFIFLTFISTCTCDRLRQSRSCLILLVVLLAAQFATATTRSGTAQGARHRQRHHPRTDGRGAPHRSTYRRRHARDDAPTLGVKPFGPRRPPTPPSAWTLTRPAMESTPAAACGGTSIWPAAST